MRCVSNISSRKKKREKNKTIFTSAKDFKRLYRSLPSLSNFQTFPSKSQLGNGRKKKKLVKDLMESKIFNLTLLLFFAGADQLIPVSRFMLKNCTIHFNFSKSTKKHTLQNIIN